MRRGLGVFACAFGALGPGCESPLELRGSEPVAPTTTDPLHATGSRVDIPAPGDAFGATLADGWPIWIVRATDGSITVVDAVAPRPRSGATLFASYGALVRWSPTTRHLIAGDVAYDERGRVLGYADSLTIDPSPPPDDVPDLATFAFTVDGDRLAIGAPQPPRPVPEQSHWVDYDRAPHVSRELPASLSDRLLAAPAEIIDAESAAIGSYHLVRGQIAQSSADAPRVCGCGGCISGEPVAIGMPSVRINEPTEHLEPAMMLVRRDPDGLAVLATSRAGGCAM